MLGFVLVLVLWVDAGVGVRVGVSVRVRVRVLGVGLAMTCHVLEGSSLLPMETRYTRDIGEIQGRRRGYIAEI